MRRMTFFVSLGLIAVAMLNLSARKAQAVVIDESWSLDDRVLLDELMMAHGEFKARVLSGDGDNKSLFEPLTSEKIMRWKASGKVAILLLEMKRPHQDVKKHELLIEKFSKRKGKWTTSQTKTILDVVDPEKPLDLPDFTF